MRCPECGALVPEGKSCQENLHALLFLEGEALAAGEVSRSEGLTAHFYAVASYNLQHPDSMGLTVEALDGLRTAVREMLVGAIDVPALRARNSRMLDGDARVTRREGDPVASREGVEWAATVADVVAAGPSEYRRSVESWARGVVDALDDADRRGSGTLNR